MAKTFEAMSLKNQGGQEPAAGTATTPQPPPPRPGSGGSWHCLDLRNMKQKSDIEKKMNFLQSKREAKAFSFVSSRHQEGVSTIFVNLAKYMAFKKKSKKILLVEGNFRNPTLAKAFNLPTSPGLTDLLNDQCSPEQAIHHIPQSNLSLVPQGEAGTLIESGIEQEKFYDFIDQVKKSFDTILIDAAPLLTSGDAVSAAAAADASFLVIRAQEVQRQVAEKAKLILQENDCSIAGVVLNRTVQVIPSWLYKIF